MAISTQYFDGLGRPIQAVSRQASPLKQDIIQPMAYDALGRQPKQFLPYVQGALGEYRPNGLQEQWDFYQQPPVAVASSGYAFAEQLFEASPLDRVIKSAAPGESWRMDGDREVSFAWRSNTIATDGEIPIWQVNENSLLPQTNGTYRENQLYITTTTDEHRSQVLEYKDKLGLVVLKKVQLTDNPSPTSTEDYMWTFYVYDDFNRLRVVIQPEGVKQAQAASWNISEDLAKKFCFRYRYDGRGRMIEKWVPGADPVEMVYNKRDLLVLSRDGNQKEKKEWSFTKYDQLNRPVLTGIYKIDASRDDIQLQANADNIQVEVAEANTAHMGYSSNAFPRIMPNAASTNSYYLSVTYYDHYDLDRNGVEDEAIYHLSELSPEPEPASNNIGRVTASKVRVLGSADWLTTLSFYDSKGRPIQTQADNHLGGRDISTILYRNAVNDEVLLTKQEHTKEENSPALVSYTEFTYDHSGRLLDTYHQLGDSQQAAANSAAVQQQSAGAGAVSWAYHTGVEIDGSKITKTAAAGWGNAGASSTELLAANTPGWIEWKVAGTTQGYQMGLSINNANHNFSTGTFVIWVHEDGKARVYESNSFKGTFVNYSIGDSFKVERQGTTIRYYHNGNQFYQSLATSTEPLLVDITMRLQGSYVEAVQASFVNTPPPASTAGMATWTSHTGVLVEGRKITKTAPTGWGNAGASSEEQLGQNANGWIEWSISDGPREYQLGLSEQNPNHNFSTGTYTLWIHGDGKVRVYERGGFKFIRNTLFQTGDRFRIERQNGSITYYHNGILFYTSTETSTASLLVDIALNNQGTSVDGVKASFIEGVDEPIASSRILLSRNAYNELGELISKKLHSEDEDHLSFLQKIDYRYNIRGWLTSINDLEADAPNVDALFSMNLYYDRGFQENAFNGNIAGMKWKSANSTEVQAYGYLYDRANRIKGADYVAGSPGNWDTAADRFDVGNITYDLNGNILSLDRNGLVQQNGEQKIYDNMDRLGYRYSGNRLLNVTDAGSRDQGFKQASTTSADTYFYDANGNMERDLNKNINNIGYNHLNLPQEVVKEDGSKIVYTYDAAGIKLRQQVYDAAEHLLRQGDYIGGMVYENKQLQFMQHAEGRLVLAQASADVAPEYQYHLKDHLGNVRLTFTSRPQVDHYLATMETENAQEEESQFLNMHQSRAPVILALDHTHTNPRRALGHRPEVARLNGSKGVHKGPRKTLRVLPGDTIRAQVWAKYLDMQKNRGMSADAILMALSGAPGFSMATEAGGTRIIGENGASMLMRSPTDDSPPKAFLSWQFVADSKRPQDHDGGFKAVSRKAAIGRGNAAGHHELLEIEYIVTKAGYMNLELDLADGQSYSPETRDMEVYFDDFQVSHHHGLIIQEDSYYPFGLTFNSYQKEGGLENKYLYNGIEKQDDIAEEFYLAHYRSYDASLGRWMQTDPKASERESPYVGMGNNPILYSDFLGDTIRVRGSEEFVAQFNKDRAELEKTKAGKALFKYLDEHEKDVTITEAWSVVGVIKNFFSEGSGDADNLAETSTDIDHRPDGYHAKIEYSQADGVEVDGVKSKSYLTLNHELSHAKDILDGTYEKEVKANPSTAVEKSEIRAVQRTNEVRQEKGITPLRTKYTLRNKVINIPVGPKKK
ncbi:RHS repeat-associated core domain protein [Cesiribacter andamanensis AMV16]|uniref:RHS repeat-associated core domain protein n=1 Tax=Cesiribacter andamanensis AMV16 TaxID=1279009 RepID=M7N694_9BACT|nr:RHS repeat-associated core domain protein [Cesiribacter andamanensis AMV16]